MPLAVDASHPFPQLQNKSHNLFLRLKRPERPAETLHAVVAIPLVTAAMAGGWLAFMGVNMLNNFRVYHREQNNHHALPAPNPAPSNIPRHKADTWRNTFRQAFGISGGKVDLNGCIDCHASKSNGSVLGSNQNFCQSCHAYAAVNIDCFECHQPKPGKARIAGIKP